MFYPDLFSHSALLLHGALSGQSRQSVSASERDLTHVIWPAERSEENISDRENISVLKRDRCDPISQAERRVTCSKGQTCDVSNRFGEVSIELCKSF